jgi:glucokinase
MAVIGLDLGGTKLSAAIFDRNGNISLKTTDHLAGRKGKDVGKMVVDQTGKFTDGARKNNLQIDAIGISVPGIYHRESGRVWANNIPGWDDYPLMDEFTSSVNDQKIKILIDNDRVCSLLGEAWMGNARNCRDVIFLLVGTGIGAGILADGTIISGSSGAAGAAGWLALDRPFSSKYTPCGCFEYHASGNGISKITNEYIRKDKSYNGILKTKPPEKITAHDVFSAYESKDALAIKVLEQAVEFWGMTIANLVSLFNPEKIILGGGIFGPGLQFIDAIMNEAKKWAQPLSIRHIQLEGSALGTDTALYGAGYLALKSLEKVMNGDKKI